MNNKNLYCFVCDIAVSNRYFALATCRTQSSKKKLIEKLGYLVGDKYMVVITEDDVICRSCANLMNTLDRLEVEMGSVRRVVLRFLERKYSLEEGELLSQTSSDVTSTPADKPASVNFMVRKKMADEEQDIELENVEDPKSRIWMQCDKCQYTTNYTSFVNNHIRNAVCLNCEAPLKNGVCSQNCETEKEDTNDENLEKSNPDSELVGLISSETDLVKNNDLRNLTLISEEMDSTDKLAVALHDPNNVLTIDKREILPADMDNNDMHALYLQVINPDESENGNIRQVVTLTNDGSVEMMEVLWNAPENNDERTDEIDE